MYRSIIFFIFSIASFYCANLDIDFIINANDFYKKIKYIELSFNEKIQTLEFTVNQNMAKELLLADICYIRLKNNKNIILKPVPRVELITGEVINATFESVKGSIKEETAKIILKNPEWYTKKIEIDFKKLRRIINENTTKEPEKDMDYIIFKSKDDEKGLVDYDKGLIDSITTDEIIIDSAIYKEQKKYKIRNDKNSTDAIAQIHIAELDQYELDKKTLYVVVVIGDGSKIIGKLKRIQSGKVTVESLGLGNIEISSTYIHSIYTINSHCTFLSDLDISDSKTFSIFLKKIPDFDYSLDFYNIMKDCASKTCTPISIAKEQFPKGLGIHSTTILKIKLDKKFKKFFSFYGIDDNILENYNPSYPWGIVNLKIYGDKKLLFARKNIKFPQKINSFTADKKNSFKVNVENVNVLKIIVQEPVYPVYMSTYTWGRFSLGVPILTTK